MYNVLIAEDSKPILRNLKGLLEASGLPLRVAATAVNGEEALERFRNQSFDILLTDIRMPKLDGLTLIAEAKRLQPELKAVLISSYSDFEYTRKALNLQVSDYLMKPVEQSQLTEVLANVLEQIRQSQPNSAAPLRDLIDNQSWRELEQNPEPLQAVKKFVLLRRQPFSGLEPFKPDIVRSLLSLPDPSWILPSPTGESLLILCGENGFPNEVSPQIAMDDLRHRLKEYGSSSLAASLQPTEWSVLPEKIREASLILEDRLPVFRSIALDVSQPRYHAESSFDEIDKLADGYSALIQQHEKDRFLLLLSAQLAKWIPLGLRWVELERFVRRLAASFVEGLESVGSLDSAEVPPKAEKLLELSDYDKFREELLRFSEECFDVIRASHRKSGPELFQQIDQYLQTNLYANVTIQDLVNRFHVSPSYISRIVKRQCGQTFVHYYTDLKINEARRLMEAKPEMLIKEIAEILCFGDQHYFSKVFKDKTGASPLEYKSRLQENSGSET